jgi:hypothetical protein
MNWIDESVAVGELTDKFKADLRDTLIMDVRDAFIMSPVVLPVDPPIYDIDPIPWAVHALASNIVLYTRKNYNRVLLHCRSGMDRSPFIATLYRMKRYGEDFNTAYGEVKKARPQTVQHWEWREIAENTF